MGDVLHHPVRSRASVTAGVTSGKEFRKKSLVAAIPRAFQQTIFKHISSVNGGRVVASNIAWNTAIFVLKIAALEAVRRISKAKCPFLWNSLQGLQCLCYPPLKWIQRWAPFKGLIKAMQTLSRPLLVLTIAETLTDQLEHNSETSESIIPHTSSESNSVPDNDQSPSDTRIEEESQQAVISEDWLEQLYEELRKQQISLPERLNEDEIRRFHRISNGDFTSLLSSIKKTIRWRETYRILSVEELEKWSSLVFWHGYDKYNRPCLIVRLGLACLTLTSNERPRFAQAIISQVEHGVVHLMKPSKGEVTVMVDCEGLSPIRIPMQMMRSCSSLLQDHFPNRLGCLFIIRLPPVLRLITQTFIQILRPNTQKKLRIEGEMFERAVREYMGRLPLYLGGDCNCKECCKQKSLSLLPQEHKGSNKRETPRYELNLQQTRHVVEIEEDPDPYICSRVLRTAVVLLLMLWLFGALVAGLLDPLARPF